MKKSVIISFILVLLMTSCFYVDGDQHYINIESEYSPEVTITSNLDALDSIVLKDSLMFKYELSIDTGRLYAVNMYFDDVLIYSRDTLQDSVWIDPYYVRYDGEYELYFIAFFKSYTGSLADLYDAEFMVADTSWIVSLKRAEEE